MAVPDPSLPAPPPAPRTPLIGRMGEQLAVRSFLLDEAVPLVTLTGPGGVGKTRLSLALAQELATQFADGVVFIDLAPLTDATLVATTIAGTLGVEPNADRAITDAIVLHLQAKQRLLILDNCEHVVVAASACVSAVLSGCPAVQVLATSRTPLRVRGELVLPVPPLSLPKANTTTLEAVRAAEAVTLFVQRARSAHPAFTLSDANASAVAAICQRLDGLPLALELAAARTHLLAPAALLALLEQRLQVLGTGPRDVPARHQTIREAIAWSYDLLTQEEQALFRRLAVFAGGFDLDAAAAICGANPPSTLRLLGGLVDHSLIVPLVPSDGKAEAGSPRFRMLETLREFGLEVLAERQEGEATRDLHATYFVALAEQAEGQLFGGPEQPRWLAHLEADHDNLRAAFDWCEARGHHEWCLRLGSALWVFWEARGHWREGRDRLRRALQDRAGSEELLRVAALRGLAAMEVCLDNTPEVSRLFAETLLVDRRLGDKGGIAHANYMLGVTAWKEGDLDQAAELLESALGLYREIRDRGGCLSCHRRPWCARAQTALLLGQVAAVADERGEVTRAKPLLNESLSLLRPMGDQFGLALVLRHLGTLELRQGNPDGALPHFAEALALFRELDLPQAVAETLLVLGETIRQRDPVGQAATRDQAIASLTEALTLFRERQDQRGIGSALLALAACARDWDEPQQAEALAEEARRLARGLSDTEGIAEALNALGDSAYLMSDMHRAHRCYDESLRLLVASDEQARSRSTQRRNRVVSGSVRGLAAVAEAVDKPEQAAELRRVVARHEMSRGRSFLQDGRALAHTTASLRASLHDMAVIRNESAAPARVAAGNSAVSTNLVAAAHLDQAITFDLTRREQEILELLCQRWTDPEIARYCFISPRTVNRHVSNILAKLGATNRREIAAIAARGGLTAARRPG